MPTSLLSSRRGSLLWIPSLSGNLASCGSRLVHIFSEVVAIVWLGMKLFLKLSLLYMTEIHFLKVVAVCDRMIWQHKISVSENPYRMVGRVELGRWWAKLSIQIALSAWL